MTDILPPKKWEKTKWLPPTQEEITAGAELRPDFEYIGRTFSRICCLKAKITKISLMSDESWTRYKNGEIDDIYPVIMQEAYAEVSWNADAFIPDELLEHTKITKCVYDCGLFHTAHREIDSDGSIIEPLIYGFQNIPWLGFSQMFIGRHPVEDIISTPTYTDEYIIERLQELHAAGVYPNYNMHLGDTVLVLYDPIATVNEKSVPITHRLILVGRSSYDEDNTVHCCKPYYPAGLFNCLKIGDTFILVRNGYMYIVKFADLGEDVNVSTDYVNLQKHLNLFDIRSTAAETYALSGSFKLLEYNINISDHTILIIDTSWSLWDVNLYSSTLTLDNHFLVRCSEISLSYIEHSEPLKAIIFLAGDQDVNWSFFSSVNDFILSGIQHTSYADNTKLPRINVPVVRRTKKITEEGVIYTDNSAMLSLSGISNGNNFSFQDDSYSTKNTVEYESTCSKYVTGRYCIFDHGNNTLTLDINYAHSPVWREATVWRLNYTYRHNGVFVCSGATDFLGDSDRKESIAEMLSYYPEHEFMSWIVLENDRGTGYTYVKIMCSFKGVVHMIESRLIKDPASILALDPPDRGINVNLLLPYLSCHARHSPDGFDERYGTLREYTPGLGNMNPMYLCYNSTPFQCAYVVIPMGAILNTWHWINHAQQGRQKHSIALSATHLDNGGCSAVALRPIHCLYRSHDERTLVYVYLNTNEKEPKMRSMIIYNGVIIDKSADLGNFGENNCGYVKL